MVKNQIECKRVLGKDLSKIDLKVINDFRKKEFNSSSLIDPKLGNDDWDRNYFLLKEDGKLLAFGRLHDVKAAFKGEVYEIYGIATIVSTVKGKGYGKKLMGFMKTFIIESGRTALGFCNSDLSDFYMKSGYKILPATGRRFLYKDPEGNLVPSEYANDDVIYLEGSDFLITKILNNPDEIVLISRKHW